MASNQNVYVTLVNSDEEHQMANVWPVYDGKNPTGVGHWAVMPLDDAIRVLGVAPENFLTDLTRTPKFGNLEHDLTWVGYRHVVIEVGDDEAKAGWKSGFYESPLAPSEAFYKLMEWRIENQIGRDWRVELAEGRDADGERAVWAWIALRVDAAATAWAWENRERIQSQVRKTVAESGITDWVFVRFRKDEEERAAS